MAKQKRCRGCKRLRYTHRMRYGVCEECQPGRAVESGREKLRKAALAHAYELLEGDANEYALCCAVCGRIGVTRKLNVDHNHKTNEVRGVLCYRCNYGLSWFQDNPERMQAAAAYLAITPRYRLDFALGRCVPV